MGRPTVFSNKPLLSESQLQAKQRRKQEKARREREERERRLAEEETSDAPSEDSQGVRAHPFPDLEEELQAASRLTVLAAPSDLAPPSEGILALLKEPLEEDMEEAQEEAECRCKGEACPISHEACPPFRDATASAKPACHVREFRPCRFLALCESALDPFPSHLAPTRPEPPPPPLLLPPPPPPPPFDPASEPPATSNPSKGGDGKSNSKGKGAEHENRPRDPLDTPKPRTRQGKRRAKSRSATPATVPSTAMKGDGSKTNPDSAAGCQKRDAQQANLEETTKVLQHQVTLLTGRLEEALAAMAQATQQATTDTDERGPKRHRPSQESLGGMVSEEERLHQRSLMDGFANQKKSKWAVLSPKVQTDLIKLLSIIGDQQLEAKVEQTVGTLQLKSAKRGKPFPTVSALQLIEMAKDAYPQGGDLEVSTHSVSSLEPPTTRTSREPPSSNPRTSQNINPPPISHKDFLQGLRQFTKYTAASTVKYYETMPDDQFETFWADLEQSIRMHFGPDWVLTTPDHLKTSLIEAASHCLKEPLRLNWRTYQHSLDPEEYLTWGTFYTWVLGTRVMDSIPQKDIDLSLLSGPGSVRQGTKSIKTYITAFTRQLTKAKLNDNGMDRLIMHMFRSGLNEEFQKESQFCGEEYITSLVELQQHLLKVESVSKTAARSLSLMNKSTRPNFNPANHRGNKYTRTLTPQANAIQNTRPNQNTRTLAPKGTQPESTLATVATGAQAHGGPLAPRAPRAPGAKKIQYQGNAEELRKPLRNNANLKLFQCNWLSDSGYCFYCLEKLSDCTAWQQGRKCLSKASLTNKHFDAGCPRSN